jgi:hypothetical protein
MRANGRIPNEFRHEQTDGAGRCDAGAGGDLVLAGVNEALRSATAKVEAKAQAMQADLLGGLGLPGLGG